MIYRKNELGFLLDSAFGRTTISLSEGHLKFSGDWYTNCTFRNIDLEHYTELFRHVLLSDSETVLVIDKNGRMNTNVERSAVISGLMEYLHSYGVFDDVIEADTPVGRKYLFTVLKNTILPAILVSESGKERYEVEIEDIEEDLLDAMKRINTFPYSNKRVMESLPKWERIEFYDPNVPKDECNFNVKILGRQIIKNRFQTCDEWVDPKVGCPLIYGMEENTRDEVCMNFFVLSRIDKDMPTNLEMLSESEPGFCYSNHVLELHLSNYKPNESLIANVEYNYKTKVSPHDLADYKGYKWYEIKEMIDQNGRSQIYDQITRENGRLTQYCNQLFQYIHDLLTRAFSLDMNKIIRGEMITKNGENKGQLGVEDYNSELKKIIVNISQATSTIRSLHQKASDYGEQCYLVIQSVLQSHIHMLNQIATNGSDFVRLIDCGALCSHVKEIKKYVKKLEEFLEIQEIVMEDNADLYKITETITDQYTYRDPEMLKNYKTALKKYLTLLENEIKRKKKGMAVGED